MPIDIKIKFNDRKAKKFFADIGNKAKDIDNATKAYANGVGSFVFKNFIQHFEQEKGPKGKWAAWSPLYAKSMARRGRSGNKILQDTGQLRQAFKPTDWRRDTRGIMFFNNAKTRSGFPYAKHHDETAKVTRPFMWVDKKTLNNISKFTLAFMLRGK